VAAVTDAIRTQLKLDTNQGVVVAAVIPNSPAQQSGILANDVILKIDNTAVTDVAQFLSLLKNHSGGPELQAGLIRDGKPLDVQVALKPLPFETSPAFDILYKSVAVDGARRRVIISKPKENKKYPAALLVGGIGCYSLDNPLGQPDPYVKILYGLTERGF